MDDEVKIRISKNDYDRLSALSCLHGASIKALITSMIDFANDYGAFIKMDSGEQKN